MTHSNRFLLRALVLITLLALGTAFVAAQPPNVGDDAYTVNVNGNLSVAAGGGLLANDVGFNPTTHRIETYDMISQFGGTVSVLPDGSFTYDPVPAFRGIDSFSYTVRTGGGARRGIATITVAGDTVWFVNGSAGTDGDGTFNSPFNSFTRVNGVMGVGDADAVGDTIFIYNGTYTLKFDLESGQKLIGEAEGLSAFGIPPGTAPVLNNVDGDPVVELFGTGGSVRGFSINTTNGKAIAGSGSSNFTLANLDISAAVTTVSVIEFITLTGSNTITDVHVTGSTGSANAALALINNSGTITVTGSTVSSFSGGYVLHIASNSGTIAFDAASDISGTNVRGIRISSLASGSVVTLAGVNVTGGVAGEPLIWLLNNHADSTVNFEEGVIANATATSVDAFNANSGSVKIGGTTSALTADAGSALVLETVQLTQDATFVSLSSTNAAADGVLVRDPVGGNDVVVSGTTTITNPTSAAIRAASTTASGFALRMNRLVASGGAIGLRVNNTSVEVTDNTSTLTLTAGIGIACSNGQVNLSAATVNVDGGDHAVSFDTCSGTITVAGGTWRSTAGATNAVIEYLNSTVALTFSGLVAKNNTGHAVMVDGMATPGALTLLSVGGTNASRGISISNSSRPVTFGTVYLGASLNRFTTAPITLAGNTGAINLGVVDIFTNGLAALEINYANASPGLVTTLAGSRLNVAGAATALRVNHATAAQPINLTFDSIINTGAGAYGIDINRTSGSLTVTDIASFGAKTTAGVSITNSSLVTSITRLDINGAAAGVRLANNTGSFSIVGDGNMLNPGTNSLGGTFTSIGSNAFNLTNVTNVQIGDVTVNGTGSHAVTGTGVSGTTIFNNVDMTNIGGIGTNDAEGEHAFNFQEGATSGAQVSGTLRINHSVISNFADSGLYLENFSGALNLYVNDNQFDNNVTNTFCEGTNCSGHGLLLRADGTAAINALIQNNNIDRIGGLGISANPEGSAGARMDLRIIDNTLTANVYSAGSPLNGEIAISLRNAQGSSNLAFDMRDNHFYNYSGEFALGIVEVEGGDFTTTHGTIYNNEFHHVHFGDMIGINADGGNTSGVGTTDFDLVLNIENNRSPTTQYGSAVYVTGQNAISGSDANAQITIQNNTFSASPSGGSFFRTLMFKFGDYNKGCFNITGNTIAAGNSGSDSIDFEYVGDAQMRLQGMAGSGDANAISRLNSTNTLAGGSYVGDLNSITNTTCTTPNAPLALP